LLGLSDGHGEDGDKLGRFLQKRRMGLLRHGSRGANEPQPEPGFSRFAQNDAVSARKVASRKRPVRLLGVRSNRSAAPKELPRQLPIHAGFSGQLATEGHDVTGEQKRAPSEIVRLGRHDDKFRIQESRHPEFRVLSFEFLSRV
jgi:hypothetical protein